MSLLKKIFGSPEPEQITLVADIALGRTDEPGRFASGCGFPWTPALQEEWDKRYTRCSGCNVWVKGKRTLWCEICKNKGI
ncbi:MAG TPA: hypothetical protein VGL56_10955 [Fimbriimonadaceae bacterium]|jgi:hypothetical protein